MPQNPPNRRRNLPRWTQATNLDYHRGMISSELDRVRRNTSRRRNDRIDATIAETILAYGAQSEGALTWRIDELDREWDVERLLQSNAAALALLGLALGTM